MWWEDLASETRTVSASLEWRVSPMEWGHSIIFQTRSRTSSGKILVCSVLHPATTFLFCWKHTCSIARTFIRASPVQICWFFFCQQIQGTWLLPTEQELNAHDSFSIEFCLKFQESIVDKILLLLSTEGTCVTSLCPSVSLNHAASKLRLRWKGTKVLKRGFSLYPTKWKRIMPKNHCKKVSFQGSTDSSFSWDW